MKRIIKYYARQKALKSFSSYLKQDDNINKTSIPIIMTIFRTGWNVGWHDARQRRIKLHTKEIELYGLTKKQLQLLLGENLMEDFNIFMNGKTVAIIDNKEVFYYCDIWEFIRKLK